jgi:hypothetical protein
LISRDHEGLDEAWTELTAINDEYDSVEAGAPGFLGRTYEKARAQVRDDARARYGTC